MANATNEVSAESTLKNTVYIVDLIALIRTLRYIPESFEDLTFRVLKSIPPGYKRVDMVSDSYHSNSIKSSERGKKGSAGKILLKSSKSKIPRNFNKFLSNSENKQKMVSMFDVMEEERCKVLDLLRTNKLVLAGDNFCKVLTVSTAEDFTTLISNQEEADTKVVLHSHQAIEECESNRVLLRLPSWGTSILVLIVLLLYEFKNRIVIDNGVGSSCKLIWLGSIDFSNSRLNSLEFHTFTGNDYVSSFFRKGKGICWKVLQKFSKFENAFSVIGNAIELKNDLFKKVGEYVCYLYGYRESSVNVVRHKIFQKIQVREHNVSDLSTLSPCRQVLLYHAKRANMVAYLWEKSLVPQLSYPSITDNGWNTDGSIHWLDEDFPTDTGNLLLDKDLDDMNEDDFGNEVESEDSNDEY